MLFISKSVGGVVWAENVTEAVTKFSEKAGNSVDVNSVFNLGTLIVPFVVFTMCFAGLALAFRMPKEFTAERIAKEFKKDNPDIDIENFKEEKQESSEKGEILFVQIGLWILSGGLFGFIWQTFMSKNLKALGVKKVLLHTLLSIFVPFYSIYFLIKIHKSLNALAQEQGIKLKKTLVPAIISAVIFPILPVNIIALSCVQKNLNLLYAGKADEQSVSVVG